MGRMAKYPTFACMFLAVLFSYRRKAQTSPMLTQDHLNVEVLATRVTVTSSDSVFVFIHVSNTTGRSVRAVSITLHAPDFFVVTWPGRSQSSGSSGTSYDIRELPSFSQQTIQPIIKLKKRAPFQKPNLIIEV